MNVIVVDGEKQQQEVLNAVKLQTRQAYAVALSMKYSDEDIDAKVAEGENNKEIQEWQAAQTIVRMRAFAKEFRPHVEREFAEQLMAFRLAVNDSKIPKAECVKRLPKVEALVRGYLETQFYRKPENHYLLYPRYAIKRMKHMRKRFTDSPWRLARDVCTCGVLVAGYQSGRTYLLSYLSPVRGRISRFGSQRTTARRGKRCTTFIFQLLVKVAGFQQCCASRRQRCKSNFLRGYTSRENNQFWRAFASGGLAVGLLPISSILDLFEKGIYWKEV